MSQTPEERQRSQRDHHNRMHRGTQTAKAFLVETNWDAFQRGIPAEILGVTMVMDGEEAPRACFHVIYPDGREDYRPMHYGAESSRDEDQSLRPGLNVCYYIVSEEQVKAGDIPSVD